MRRWMVRIALVLFVGFLAAAVLTDGFGGALERWLLELHGVHR